MTALLEELVAEVRCGQLASSSGVHALRHTFASTLLSRGVSLKAVADWLGHANPTITLTTDAHLMPADRTCPGASSTPLSHLVRTRCGQRDPFRPSDLRFCS